MPASNKEPLAMEIIERSPQKTILKSVLTKKMGQTDGNTDNIVRRLRNKGKIITRAGVVSRDLILVESNYAAEHGIESIAKRKTYQSKVLDIIKATPYKTITKSALMEKIDYISPRMNTLINTLRKNKSVVTIYSQEDMLIIDYDYAQENDIKSLSRNEYWQQHPPKKIEVDEMSADRKREIVLKFVTGHDECTTIDILQDVVMLRGSVYNALNCLVSSGIISKRMYQGKRRYSIVRANMQPKRHLKVTNSHLTPIPTLINYPEGKKVVIEQETVLKPGPVRKIQSLFNWEG